MIFEIWENGEKINIIAGTEASVSAYAERNGYSAVRIIEDNNLSVEQQIAEIRQKQQELQSVLDELLGV